MVKKTTKPINKTVKNKNTQKMVKPKESLSVINPDKKPHAHKVSEIIKQAKESGTYMTAQKMKKAATSTSFKADQPRPKKFTCCEAFAEHIGWDIVDSWVEKAKDKINEGDTTCLLFMLERVFPKGKPERRIRSSIRDLLTLDDVHKAYTAIINETASGDLDIDDARTLIEMVSKKEGASIVELEKKMDILIKNAPKKH